MQGQRTSILQLIGATVTRKEASVSVVTLSLIQKSLAEPAFSSIEVRKRVWLFIQWSEARLEEPPSPIIAVDLSVEAHEDGQRVLRDKDQPAFLVFTAGSDLDGLQNDLAQNLLRLVRAAGQDILLDRPLLGSLSDARKR